MDRLPRSSRLEDTSRISAVVFGATLLVPLAAHAAEPAVAVSADADAEAEAEPPKDRGDKKWIHRWAPERNMVELGIFAGGFFPHPRLELFEADATLINQGFKEYNQVTAEIGGRVGYYPAKFLGIEAEAGVMPTEVPVQAQATVYAARGHVIAQLARWSVTPFILAGATGLGVTSPREAVGNDIDPGFHFGGGVKIFADRQIAVRLDIRDTITARRGRSTGAVHSPEILFGVTFTLGREKDEPKPVAAPVDTDGDGIFDPDDKCVETPGVAEYDGCPIPDTDGDGILDPDDKCPDVAGIPEYDGCTVPDTDGDGVIDTEDKCVDVAGSPDFEGCPVPDTDGDGILDTEDKCPQEAETVNNFEDEDGCADEVPKEVAKFTGVIEGIYFDSAKATIKDKSKPQLDKAVEVLKKFEGIHLEVSGHTDDRGNDDYNMKLSSERAASVKQYFVDAGIAADRITTRGAGETSPIESNKTSKGRAKNRRIEFKLVQ